MGDLRVSNGVVLEESWLASASPLSFPAEFVTEEIISLVRPTFVSEARRKHVLDYVLRILTNNLGCEAFLFGSVPLKTYLPDGDIDITAFCGFNSEDRIANDLSSVLEKEGRNPAAEFVVKDVQYIRAEVKLIKCLVQNIVVDISFNQCGGLCTLSFLEEVNRFIGKNHLFKRSIILVKAWCYYESRILGAHHGLISTYALELLVLYIFHVFHSSLSGPLSVLHKFLDYYSKFDWDMYCVSLCGPVPISSLPRIVVEKPDNEGGDTLLSDDFLRLCVMQFAVPSRGTVADTRPFLKKHLNIVDPLKENNNLGRSVNEGNFHRIRSAFAHGARKLGETLSQPQENIENEVRKYFGNTLERHRQGQRTDVSDLWPMSGNNEMPLDLRCTADAESSQEESCSHKSNEDMNHVVACNNVRGPGCSSEEVGDSNNMVALCGNRDLKTSTRPTCRSSTDCKKLHGRPYVSPKKNGDLCYNCNGNARDSACSYETMNHLPDLCGDVESHLVSLQYGKWWFECGHSMASLHQPNLVVPPLRSPSSSPSPPLSPLFQTNNQWDGGIQLPLQHFMQDMVPHLNVNGVSSSPPPFFPLSPPVATGTGYFDEMPRTRGIGTYFPVANHQLYRATRSLQTKGRVHGSVKSPRTNGRGSTSFERSPQVQAPVRQGGAKLRSSGSFERSLNGKHSKEMKNGFVHNPNKAANNDSGKVGIPPVQTNNNQPPNSSSEHQNGKPLYVVNCDRYP